MVQGKYYCEVCRYPPCKAIRDGKVCGNRRENPGGKHRFKEYICPSCRKNGNKPSASLIADGSHEAVMAPDPGPLSTASSSGLVASSATGASSAEKPSAVAGPSRTIRKYGPGTKRTCMACGKSYTSEGWSSPEEFQSDAGSCKLCGGKCVRCDKFKLKAEFSATNWNNFWQEGRVLVCAVCARCAAEEVHKCGNADSNPDCIKESTRDEFNRKSLYNAKERNKDSLKRCSKCRPN